MYEFFLNVSNIWIIYSVKTLKQNWQNEATHITK